MIGVGMASVRAGRSHVNGGLTAACAGAWPGAPDELGGIPTLPAPGVGDPSGVADASDEGDGVALSLGVAVAECVDRGVVEALPAGGAVVAVGAVGIGGAAVVGGGAVGGRVGFGVGGFGVGIGVGALITTLAGEVVLRVADFSPAPEPLVAEKE